MHLDHAASSGFIAPAVASRMIALLQQPLGNPSSPHKEGRLARRVLREAREEAAGALGAHPDEVIFTSGVTESLHLAVHGLGQGNLVTSLYEHKAVSSALESTGLAVVKVDPAQGVPAAGLYAFSAVSNELGWRLDLDALHVRAPLIIDGAQATLYAPDIWAQPKVTALALPSHKIGGPTGVGLLLLRKDRPFVRVLRGGHQENELRAGTEAVIAIAGFARRLSTLLPQRREVLAHLELVTRAFWQRLSQQVRGARNYSEQRPSLPGILALGIVGVSGRQLVDSLDAEGINVSSKAACGAHADASAVLLNAGLSRERALEAIRVSFDYEVTVEEVLQAADRVAMVARRLRGELQMVVA